jgi:aminopeptidase 2
MARRAFPCWDEPLFKATYSITLVSRSGTVNLSNMPAVSEETYENAGESAEQGPVQKLFEASNVADASKGWKVTRFAKTPRVRLLFL